MQNIKRSIRLTDKLQYHFHEPSNSTEGSHKSQCKTPQDDGKYTKQFDLAMAMNLEKVMRHLSGNKYMMEFIEKYESMDKKYMFNLSDGTYLEERLFKFGLSCTHRHLCHSFIFDPGDPTYIQQKVLSEDHIEEIQSTEPIKYPDMDDNSVNYLMKFVIVNTTEDIRAALYKYGDYNKNYNKIDHQIKDLIRRSLDHLLLIYESTDDCTPEYSEQWYQAREHHFNQTDKINQTLSSHIIKSCFFLVVDYNFLLFYLY